MYAQVEARLEFSEDGLPPLDVPALVFSVSKCRDVLHRLLESYAQGRVLREGLVVALVGAPNVGKSSLLNALLGLDRAIVTSQPGTTRDVVEGEMRLAGQRVRLFDTAGLRISRDPIEEEGMKRSRQVIDEADLVLWILDASEPSAGFPEALNYKEDPRARFLVNKTDLRSDASFPLPSGKTVHLSCKTGEGVEKVRDVLSGALQEERGSSEVVLTQERHKREITQADGALGRLQDLMEKGNTQETWAEELKEAALCIGRVRGRNLPDDAFQDIFSKFCIGK
jgi:tRNA modification GTPase